MKNERLSREKIAAIAASYLEERKRDYIQIDSPNSFRFEESQKLIFGNLYGEKRDVYSVRYGVLWGFDEVSFFIEIDAYTGEVYYTITPQGFAEEWE